MQIKIEKATLENLETIRKLNHQLFEHDYPYDNFLFKNWANTADAKKYFEKALTENNYCTLIAKENDEIIGYLVGVMWGHWESRPTKTAEIDNMLVLKSARGKGVGKLLISKFKNWCLENGAKDLMVMAYAENKNALEFYRKNGFEDLSIRLHQKL